MAPLRRAVAALALVLGSPVPAPADAREIAATVLAWRPHIREASLRFGLPPAWIERVIQAESRGLTALAGAPIRSRAGAMGIMQLMPATWEALRRELGLGPDPDEPRANILAGSLYLRQMYDRFGYPGLFAAYNAGPGRYAEHLAARRALPAETVAYLRQVGDVDAAGQTEPPGEGDGERGGGEPSEPLFAIRGQGIATAGRADSAASPGPLFAVRADVR